MKSYEQIIADLKNKVYAPVYFLCGKEPFYIDRISDYIEDNVLDELEKEFNQNIVYGVDTDLETIIASAKKYPMMASHQVIIVKEAQNNKDIKRLINAKKDKKENNPLLSYFENPLPSTILVFCYKYDTIDKRKAFTKLVDTKGVLFESAELRDYQIPAWIENYIKSEGFTIGPKASLLLSDHLGNNLSKIANEISKLKLNIPANSEITIDHIGDHIGISKDYNIFELQSALGTKNIFKANQIINYFKDNPKENPFPLIMQILYKYFSQVLMMYSLKDKSVNEKAAALLTRPFFIKDYETAMRNYPIKKLYRIFGYLRDYDIKSKGVNNATVDHGELLKEMIFKILH